MVRWEVMMKKNILKYFGLFLSLMAVMPSWAYIVSFNQWQLPNDTEVVVLGDRHIGSIVGGRQANILTKQIEIWSKDQDKTFLILEAEKGFDYTKLKLGSVLKQTLLNIAYYFYNKRGSDGNVTSDFSDIRDRNNTGRFSFLHSYMDDTYYASDKNRPYKSKFKHVVQVVNEFIKNENKEIETLNDVFDLLLEDNGLDASQILDKIKEEYKKYFEQINHGNVGCFDIFAPIQFSMWNHTIDNKIIEFLKQRKIEYCSRSDFLFGKKYNYGELEKYMCKIRNIEDSFFDYLFSTTDDKEVPEETILRRCAYKLDLILNYFAYLSDIVFISELLKNKDKYKRIVVYVGDSHARAINEVLKEKLDAKLITMQKNDEGIKLATFEKLLKSSFDKNSE